MNHNMRIFVGLGSREREYTVNGVKYIVSSAFQKPNHKEDRIEVHETEGTGKHRTQRITIYYKFVGYIDIPECRDFHIAETRQGVAVTYLTQTA